MIRLCTVRQRLFLLSSSGNLYMADNFLVLDSLELHHVREGVLDVDSDSEMVYLVDDNHRVWQTKALSESSHWTEVPVYNDVTCPHGIRNITERVPISRVVCNNDGVLFLTTSRELYGCGDFNEILNSDSPQRIECFRGQKVLQVAAGSNFVVVLTQKKRQQQPREQGNASGASLNLGGDAMSVDSSTSEVFINAECLKCVPERDMSLLNALNHHPLGDISKSTTETSIASSACPSEDNAFEEDMPNGKSTPFKETQKDSSALNFFLDLSQQQTKILTENVTKNITTMLSEGVKSLSRHMSGSDNTDTTLVNGPEGAGTDSTQCNGVRIEDPEDGEQRQMSNSNLMARVLLEKHGEESVEHSEASNSLLDLGSATDLHSDFRMSTENRIARMCRIGSQLLDTDVWCFGSVNRGQLGTGDHIKRTCINSVVALSGQGVQKIECGMIEFPLNLQTLIKKLSFQAKNIRQHLLWTEDCLCGEAMDGIRSVQKQLTTSVRPGRSERTNQYSMWPVVMARL